MATDIKSANQTSFVQNAVAARQASPLAPKQEKMKDLISASSVKDMFKNAMAEHADTFLASVVDLYNNDKNLQNCSPNEVLMECFKAATLKLPINKQLGFAYVVPFNDRKLGKTVPQFQLGYKGLIQLAMRTGAYKHINGGPVFEGELLSENKLTGEIDMSGKKINDKVLGFFAYIETTNGFSKTMFWPIEKVTAHAKKYSKAFAFGPWQSDFDAMATKTVMRSLLGHYGIMSVEMQNAYVSDSASLADQQIAETDGQEHFNGKPVIEVEPEVEDEKPLDDMGNLSMDDLPEGLR